jgi:hypothetical protein
MANLVRKTALMRKTELRRTPMPRTKRTAVAKVEKIITRSKRRRETGPNQTTRTAVLGRAGWRCEICGGPLDGWDGLSIHHRQPRGMGGSNDPALNTAVNLLALCGSATSADGCHHLVESQRALARNNGWLVPRPDSPTEIPVRLHGDRLVYLTPDAQYAEGTP